MGKYINTNLQPSPLSPRSPTKLQRNQNPIRIIMAGRIAYLGNISTQGLVLDLDAAIQGSYPKTGSLWTDISGNNNNGTLTNGPTYTGSDYGAIVFDGTDDYVEVGDVASLDQTFTTITINTWLKPALVSTEKAIMGKMGGSGNRGFQFTLFSGSTVTMDYFSGPSGTEAVLYTPSPLLSSSFSNVCFVFNGGISHTFYQNGAPITSSTISIPATFNGSNSAPFRLGDRGDSIISKYTGSIATAQIYNQALSQFQVWQNFNAYKSRYGIPDIVTDGLVLNLDAGNPYSYLSGSSGTTWTNTVAVSSSISGTLVNGPVYSNGAITFDGTKLMIM
jgi:hypothetical protein